MTKLNDEICKLMIKVKKLQDELKETLDLYNSKCDELLKGEKDGKNEA